MPLTPEEVLHVAHLARLRLSPEEVARFTRQLNDILNYVAKLAEVDTREAAPLAHVVPLTNAFRADEVLPSLPREQSLANAPEGEGGSFVVPRVI